MGPKVLAGVKRDMLLTARLVPMEDYRMVSGSFMIMHESDRKALYQLARDRMLKNPSRVFQRNPAKLKEAWDMQAEDRSDFIAFFGSDLVVVEGASLARKTEDLLHYKVFIKKGEDGSTAADRARRHHGVTPALPKVELPQDLLAAPTVAIIYDEKEGLNYYAHFGLFQETFERPELVNDRRHRDVVRGYLKSASVSTLPFRRMAQMYPSSCQVVLADVAGWADFNLERDFEKLLRRYKRKWMERTFYPSVLPVEGL